MERAVYGAIEQVGLPAERAFLHRYPGEVSVDTMGGSERVAQIAETARAVRARTSRPFGVNRGVMSACPLFISLSYQNWV